MTNSVEDIAADMLALDRAEQKLLNILPLLGRDRVAHASVRKSIDEAILKIEEERAALVNRWSKR